MSQATIIGLSVIILLISLFVINATHNFCIYMYSSYKEHKKAKRLRQLIYKKYPDLKISKNVFDKANSTELSTVIHLINK